MDDIIQLTRQFRKVKTRVDLIKVGDNILIDGTAWTICDLQSARLEQYRYIPADLTTDLPGDRVAVFTLTQGNECPPLTKIVRLWWEHLTKLEPV